MSKSLVAALTAAVFVVFTAIRVADLAWWRAQTLAAADTRAANLSFILSEYLREMFAAGDTSLRQLALHSRRIGGPSAPDGDWMPSLRSAMAGLAGVGSISVTDTSGRIIYSTQPLIVGQSRADEFIFKRLAAQSADELVVGEPYLARREPRQYVIPMGRRLVDAGGAFTGTITATIVPSSQRAFLRTVNVGRHGTVWVFHPNGFVLFREPSAASETGTAASANPVFAEARRTGGSGTVRAPLDPGGPVFLSGYRTTTTPPVVVAVSLDRGEVLADWQHQAQTSALLFAALAVGLAAMLTILFRQMDAKAAAERELADAHERESARLQEMNVRLAGALDAEQRASTLKDEFLMTVSHELRTPLTAIHGWARILGTVGLDETKRRSAVDTIERNARAQMKLVDDLLDVSGVLGGKLRLDVRTVDVATLLDETIETLLPAADARGIRIERAAGPEVGTITGDPDRLQQIVWNLLSNAVKFTPPGGRVDVSARRADGALEIAVADTGAGISPAFLPHVFDRFRQEEGGSTRRHGGLGLGLAIVRHLVELHGGSVHAESGGEGRGATFRVRLPSKSVH